MKKKATPSVVVAMSGGVDSSVAALLLKNRNYHVTGVFMRCYNLDGCAARDAEDARRVAEHIGIPFYVWNFEEEYKERVVNYMVAGYRAGMTPNPDVMCNKEIKFGLFFDRARKMGADYIATGHYVRRVSDALFTARDTQKDQSYFLWTLTPEHISRSLFPVGEYLKPEVRDMARRAGLPTAEKKDSQGICFLGKVTLADFLRRYIPDTPGVVLGTGGTKLGEHRGAQFYTIGQRRGIGNIKHERGQTVHQPLYVSGKDVATNTVTVVRGEDNPALFRKKITLSSVNMLDDTYRNGTHTVSARVRYRQPRTDAALTVSEHSAELVFTEPQKFVAPGQSAVFYTPEGRVIGGGIIV